MIDALFLTLSLAAGTPTVEVPAPVGRAGGRPICVPARDAAGKPTGRLICRTAQQWESFLRDHGYAEPTRPFRLTGDSFVAPDQLYRPRR
jgi:hypothetical protein